ncbi:MAG TPA: metallophosphoesterase [Marmoricola sp.]|nr:metallophosphoesterase [Marmoricola sp.]
MTTKLAVATALMMLAGCFGDAATVPEDDEPVAPQRVAESVAEAHAGTDVRASSSLRQRRIRLAVIGDINPGDSSTRYSIAGRIASSIRAWHPRAVAVVGDFQYPFGSCEALVDQFDAVGWGRLMGKVIGAAGPTHDYQPSTTDALPYSKHMEGRCPGQTSPASLSARRWNRTIRPYEPHFVDLGAWTVISMPSGQWRSEYAEAFGPAWTGGALTRWLSRAVNRAKARRDHVVVLAHEPYWTSSTDEHPADEADAMKPWIRVLDRENVRLILSGHQHNYERFRPQTASGKLNRRRGTQQLQVSTGGVGLRAFTDRAPHSAVQHDTGYGWARLTLKRSGAYKWRYVSVQGDRFGDASLRRAP